MALELGLGEQVVDVGLHRRGRDMQSAGQLLIAQTLGHQHQHLRLPGRQTVWSLGRVPPGQVLTATTAPAVAVGCSARAGPQKTGEDEQPYGQETRRRGRELPSRPSASRDGQRAQNAPSYALLPQRPGEAESQYAAFGAGPPGRICARQNRMPERTGSVPASPSSSAELSWCTPSSAPSRKVPTRRPIRRTQTATLALVLWSTVRRPAPPMGESPRPNRHPFRRR